MTARVRLDKKYRVGAQCEQWARSLTQSLPNSYPPPQHRGGRFPMWSPPEAGKADLGMGLPQPATPGRVRRPQDCLDLEDAPLQDEALHVRPAHDGSGQLVA